jgi:hypothetical protein
MDRSVIAQRQPELFVLSTQDRLLEATTPVMRAMAFSIAGFVAAIDCYVTGNQPKKFPGRASRGEQRASRVRFRMGFRVSGRQGRECWYQRAMSICVSRDVNRSAHRFVPFRCFACAIRFERRRSIRARLVHVMAARRRSMTGSLFQ